MLLSALRRAALAVLLLAVPGMGRASDLIPLNLTFPSPVWIQSAGNIQAPAGEMPTRLTGVHTSGSFSAYLDARVSTGPDFLKIELSGTATSFQGPNDNVQVTLGTPRAVAFTMPGSSGIGQAFLDWTVTTSLGWRAYASAFSMYAIVSGIGPIGPWLGPAQRTVPIDNPGSEGVMAVVAPAGRMVTLPLDISFEATPLDRTPGPFTVTATLRASAAAPLVLGDLNGDGEADLVDSVLLRRMLVGAIVP